MLALLGMPLGQGYLKPLVADFLPARPEGGLWLAACIGHLVQVFGLHARNVFLGPPSGRVWFRPFGP